MTNRLNLPHRDLSSVQLSALTSDSVLQRIFRRLEDDGAAEVLPAFRPRPTAPAAVRVRELVEA